MKRNQLFAITAIIAIVAFTVYGCSKSGGGNTNPCANKTITVNATATNTSVGASTGSVSANATGSTNFTFSLNGGAFQATGNFNNLAKGTYTVTAKDADGCTGTTNVTVNETDVCAGKTITVGGTVNQNSDPCVSSGQITVSATGGTNFTYNINGGTFQSSAVFTNVGSGSITVGAKDGDGCVKTNTVTVNALPAGPLFTAVKAVITGNCTNASCHGGSQAPNFTVDCNIALNAARIKVRAVDQAGTPNQMPQPPNAALSQADRDKISNWVAAGGRFSN